MSKVRPLPDGLGHPIPIVLSAGPIIAQKALTCEVTINAQTINDPNGNYVIVNLDAAGQQGYRSPSNHGWPYHLSFNGISGMTAPITLAPVAGKPTPPSLKIFASHIGATKPDVIATAIAAGRLPVHSNAAEERLPFAEAIMTEAGGPLPLQVYINPDSILGGAENFECTILVDQIVSGQDAENGGAVVLVDCDRPDLLRPQHGGWPYALRIQKHMRVATFTVESIEPISPDHAPAVAHIFAYPSGDDPSQPTAQGVVLMLSQG